MQVESNQLVLKTDCGIFRRPAAQLLRGCFPAPRPPSRAPPRGLKEEDFESFCYVAQMPRRWRRTRLRHAISLRGTNWGGVL